MGNNRPLGLTAELGRERRRPSGRSGAGEETDTPRHMFALHTAPKIFDREILINPNVPSPSPSPNPNPENEHGPVHRGPLTGPL